MTADKYTDTHLDLKDASNLKIVEKKREEASKIC